MSTVLEFRQLATARPRQRRGIGTAHVGEIVIFPGVRIERHDLDLGHRVRDSAGSDDFNGLGGKRRPRKTS
jgi:hypothetical protein